MVDIFKKLGIIIFTNKFHDMVRAVFFDLIKNKI